MASPRRVLRELYRDLRTRAADPQSWICSPWGADLWIDGLTAFRIVTPETFDAYLSAALEFLSKSGHPLRALTEGEAVAPIARLDPFLATAAERGPGSFWPALAVGLCLVRALGGAPRVETGDEMVIMDDSLLFLLSPSYRGIRLAAYNAGLRTRSHRTGKQPVFRPEYGYFRLHPPNLVDAEPPRVPYYNYSHDLAHLVLFGDTYLRPVVSSEITASLLLNAEETVCTLDLVLMAELARFGIELHALSGLKKLEAGSYEEKESVTRRVAGDPEQTTAYQVALKAAAQLHLTAPSAVSEQIVGSAEIPGDLADWFHPRTQSMHAAWGEKLARRIWHPVFQRFVSFLPPQPEHTENLFRFCRETFSPGTWDGAAPLEPCPESRRKGILVHRMRFLVIRAAEVAAELADQGMASEALLEGLTRWALETVDRLVRVQREGGSNQAAEHADALAGAAASLLVRHQVPEADRFARRFDDPAAASYRSTQ